MYYIQVYNYSTFGEQQFIHVAVSVTDSEKVPYNRVPYIFFSFLLHGADIITTATYQASVDGYQKHLHLSESDAIGLIKRSVTIAKEATDWFLQQPDEVVI